MSREEKQLDCLLDAMLSRLNDLKVSIGQMIHKLETEHETINWPSLLDNYALISSHLTGLSKILAHDIGAPPLRNLVVLPLLLSPERDEALWQMTEGRIPAFLHDLVPDYLRTKPDPIAEQKMLQNEQKANNLMPDTAAKQVAQFTKVVSHVWDLVVKGREEWEVESSTRATGQQTCSLADTHSLLAAIGMGKGLKVAAPPQMMVPGPMGGGPMRPGMSPQGPPQIGKAPSGIKTNIKAANQIHPYR